MKNTFLFITILLFICLASFGQNLGVQATMNLVPPYTLSLHDYTQPGSNKLKVTVLLKDLNYPIYQARLRFTIEGSGFTLTTRANYLPPALSLQGGIPLIFNPEDLEPYFLPENLDFNGISKSDYLRSRKLPEGFYRFFVEVLDYNRGSVVSNKAMAMAYIVLNEVPVINLPANHSKLPANDPQNIFFNWTPRHLGSPNSAFSTLYEFRLYEIQPKGRNPYEAVRTSVPIYESMPALATTSFVYNVSMPSLIPGNEYAFTIRAVDRDGRDLFKNDGYSEVYMFTWGDECKPPENIQAEAVTGGGIDLRWKQAPAHTGYTIQYRTLGSSGWNIQNSFLDNASIYELPAGTEIEYQLQSVCGGYQSEYSETYSIKTKEEEKRTFVCGSGSEIAPITNRKPLLRLEVGDVFYAGGYKAAVTKVIGQNGVYSGECHVLIPYFNMARVPHKFENIRINELNQMYEGKLVSMYNPDSRFIARMEGGKKDRDEDERKETVVTGMGKVSVDTSIMVSGTIREVHTNTSGQLVILTTDGDSTILTPGEGEKAIVTDEKGNQYLADNGSVTQVTNKGGSSGEGGGNDIAEQVNNADSARALLPFIRFVQSSKAQYGFDSLKYESLKPQYVSQDIRGKDYTIPYKAVASGSIDYVDVHLPESEGYNPSKVQYSINNIPVTATSSGSNNRTLNVTSLNKKDVQVLEATYTLKDKAGKTYDETLGKLNVIAYDKQIKKLYLVPVNPISGSNYNVELIKNTLNQIYAQAVVQWDVQPHEALMGDSWDENHDGIFDDTDKDDHMDYTPDMKALRKAFRKQFTEEKDAIYVFLIAGPHKTNLSGYMPLKGQYGFIFTQNKNQDETAHTIAHEIGHGAFHLRHTFSPKNKYVLSQNTTDNLMDYTPDGKELNKYQWDQIHDPENLLFAWLENEREGELGLPCVGWFDDCVDVLKTLENFRNARINGNYIKLKGQTITNAQTLTGNSIKIGETDYSRIRIIYKPVKDDYTFDPLKYIDYNQSFISNNGTDVQTGIAYLNQSNNEFFKIIVDESEKIENLKEYLFGSGISFEVESNGKVLKENSYVTISSEPKMPIIKINNTSASDVKFRLKVEYRRDIRTDDDYFPVGEWKTVKSGESWTIDYGDKIRGGKATLFYKAGNKEFSFVFHIRGLNPTEQDVKNYINEKGYDIWFLTRLIRQESNYIHFNNGTNYGPDWSNSQGCPNWGPPHGWGLMQLDLIGGTRKNPLRPTAQELWDWKANLRRGVQFIEGEKYNSVNGHFEREMQDINNWNYEYPDNPVVGHGDQAEGNITYTHSNSDNFSYDFGDNPTGNDHSFMDAAWIKNYNGSSGGTDGYPGYYYVLKQVGNKRPYWDLHRTNSNGHNYVEAVSNRNP